MKLYHSSTVKVESPDLDHSRDYLDFGKGWKSPVRVTPEAQVPLTLESKFRMTPIKS